MKNQRTLSLNIGLPTIVLLFIVLTLLSLSILSFVSANADWKLCQKNMEHTQAYYQACNDAQRYLQSPDKTTGHKYFPISEFQKLDVVLSTREDGTYQIDSWKTALSEDIPYDEKLDIIP